MDPTLQAQQAMGLRGMYGQPQQFQAFQVPNQPPQPAPAGGGGQAPPSPQQPSSLGGGGGGGGGLPQQLMQALPAALRGIGGQGSQQPWTGQQLPPGLPGGPPVTSLTPQQHQMVRSRQDPWQGVSAGNLPPQAYVGPGAVQVGGPDRSGWGGSSSQMGYGR
jgi:hypothetical protein